MLGIGYKGREKGIPNLQSKVETFPPYHINAVYKNVYNLSSKMGFCQQYCKNIDK